jgi:hypothetical protein
MPGAVVYLPIRGGRDTLRGESDEPVYRFRYTGLRLLAKAGTTLFLISRCWNDGRGKIAMIEQREEYRSSSV